MTEEDRTVSQAEFRQTAKAHSLTAWQKQWDISEKGRFFIWTEAKSFQEKCI